MLTTLDAIKVGISFPPSDKERIETCAQVDLLLEGDHGAVFRESFLRLMRDDNTIIEIDLPWLRKTRLVFADLLCGEPGRIKATDEGQQAYLDELVARLDVWRTLHEACGDTVSYGDGVLRLKRRNGLAELQTQPPSYWYPIVAENDVRDVQAHLLAWKINQGTTETPKWVGRGEQHGYGWWQPISFTFDYSGERVAAVNYGQRLETGATLPLVFHAPNWRTSKELCGHSIFADADSILSEMEVRLGQMAKVLDKHTDPGMYGAEGGLEQDPVTKEWRVKGGQFYAVGEGEVPPGYVVWNGDLVNAIEMYKIMREELYAATDTCPALFGKLEAGMAESGSALKRLLISPLAAVNRLRLTYDTVLKQILRTAAELENVKLSTVTVTWRDGLPEDPMEASQVEQTRIAAGNTSVESSVARLDNIDGEELDAEMAKIEKDNATKQPPPPANTPPAVVLPAKV